MIGSRLEAGTFKHLDCLFLDYTFAIDFALRLFLHQRIFQKALFNFILIPRNLAQQTGNIQSSPPRVDQTLAATPEL